MVGWQELNPLNWGGPLLTTEIKELRVYPIKSCHGVSLKSCRLTKQGLNLDRQWMLIDGDTNHFLTMREIPKFTLIIPSFELPESGREEDLELVVRIQGTDRVLRISAYPTTEWLDTNTTVQTVRLWDEDVDAYMYDDEINCFFQEYFERNLVLVYKGPSARLLRGNGSKQFLGREETANFPDFMPITIANDASIEDLNDRLAVKGVAPVSINNFRPNIIVKGATRESGIDQPQAWTEDRWRLVRIRETWSSKALEIDVMAHCTRCQMPNIDPESAARHPKEPWNTMHSFRRIDRGDKRPCFAMLSVARQEGTIEVGMAFDVLEFTDFHRWMFPI